MVYWYYHSTSELIKVEPVFIGDTIRVMQVVLAGEHLLFVRKKTH